MDFQDLNSCDEHMNNGYFEIAIGDEVHIVEQNFHDQYSLNEHYLNLMQIIMSQFLTKLMTVLIG